MTLVHAILIVLMTTIVSNRIVAILTGFWLKIPEPLLIALVVGMDFLQIPVYFWIYGHTRYLMSRLPEGARGWLTKDRSNERFGQWVKSLGPIGVMFISFMPTFGGGIWTAVFLAYTLRLPRLRSSLWIGLGSVLSYGLLYWLVDSASMTIRYLKS